jgi:hypothetical protein
VPAEAALAAFAGAPRVALRRLRKDIDAVSDQNATPRTNVTRAGIDTSVVSDLELIAPADLPLELAVSAMTMAELAAGPHATLMRPNAPAAMTDCNALKLLTLQLT